MTIPDQLTKRLPFLFVLATTAVYLALLVRFNYLQQPIWWDEKIFWYSSLKFSYSLLPSFEQLRNYQELNTPLPFILYGMVEHLFHGGITVGRFINFFLSFTIVLLIGLSNQLQRQKAAMAVLLLLTCPYYLWFSVHLYTEIIASFFVLIGFFTYFKDRHILSSIAFILAIASRQYMIAFPMAIMTFELIFILRSALKQSLSGESLTANLQTHLRWIMPLIAVASILFWFWLFKGLAPAPAMAVRKAPPVQQSLWALTPSSGLYFLSIIGLYFVIPETALCRNNILLQRLSGWRASYFYIVALLLFLFIVFPPSLEAAGTLIKIANLLPFYFLKISLFYGLALLTCLRFFRPNLTFYIVLFNSLIMMKAFPWDKYVLPLVIVLCYLEATARLDREQTI